MPCEIDVSAVFANPGEAADASAITVARRLASREGAVETGQGRMA